MESSFFPMEIAIMVISNQIHVMGEGYIFLDSRIDSVSNISKVNT